MRFYPLIFVGGKWFGSAGLGALLVMLMGCATPAINDPSRTGPFFTPVNFHGQPSTSGLRRIVLLPICGGPLVSQEILSSFDAVFAEALQRENRFEIVTLSRENCLRRFRLAEFASTAELPADFLVSLQRDFAAEGVLFVDITAFRAYRPLTLGLRAKLAPITGKELVWSFDEIFSAANPAVANSARRHVLTGDRGDVPADLSPAVLQTPVRFADYAATAMFKTLPPVVMPVALPAGARDAAR